MEKTKWILEKVVRVSPTVTYGGLAMIRSRKFNNYKWHYEDNADKYINILNENLEESILKIDLNEAWTSTR